MKIFNITFFKYKKICLGDLPVKELTILEYKKLFSIKLFYFCKGNAQEIYHTHAFKAYSFLLYGNYVENILFSDFKEISLPRNRKRLLFIPKDRFHQITKSSGCMTLLVTGPWGDYYKEYNRQTKVLTINTHGRLKVFEQTI